MVTLIRPDDKEITLLGQNCAFSQFRAPYISIDGYVFRNTYMDSVPLDHIKMSKAIRPKLTADKYRVELLHEIPEGNISKIKVSVVLATSKKQKYQAPQIEEILETVLANSPIHIGQSYGFKIESSLCACIIKELYATDQKGETPCEQGVTMGANEITVCAEGVDLIEPEHKRLHRAFDPSKWDFRSIEIGGLNEELFTILRRAFLTRLMKPILREKLKIKHVKGMLLYGPPGTGKTLIARKIGTMLGLKEKDDRVRVVNGPELFSKWSGEAESRLRDIFTTKNSELHVIIFDEIESCARKRDSGSNSEISSRFVTQFLALLDGVKEQDNIFVIGMTNRKDMIDEAMLRPGRLEIHVEISLPDLAGRKEILLIHTAALRSTGMMSSTVDLDDIARRSSNFTGAELQGLVNSARSFAMTKESKISDISQMDSICVEKEDFDRAFGEIFPAFGAVCEDLDKHMRHGFLEIEGLNPNIVVEYTNSLPSNIHEKILIRGEHGCGCSAWAANLVKKANFDFIKFITPYKYLELSEGETLRNLGQIVRDSFKSRTSLIVIDDIERLIRMTTLGGISFSQYLLSGILALLGEAPPTGHKLVVAITSHESKMVWETTGLNFNIEFGLTAVSPEACCSLGYETDNYTPVKNLCAELARK